MRLQARDLVYGPARGVRFGPLDLDLTAGHLTFLMGPNGSGKSTLIRTLAGVLPRQGGMVDLDGTDMKGISRRDLACRLAYVPQMTVPANITVFEAVTIGRTPHMGFAPSPRDLLAIERAMDWLGVGAWRTRPLDELSGGERQKVLIARALAQDTPLLLLDEPAAGLDVRYQIEIYDLLKDLCTSGHKTILCAEHNMGLATRYAHTVLVLDQGRVEGVGPPAEVLSPALLRSVYGVEAEIAGPAGGLRITGLSPCQTGAMSSIIT